MIVVEGPDGSGKTTLAKWIAEEYGLEYRRAPTLSSEHGPDDEAAEWFALQLRGTTGDGGVYDRVLVISEPLYQLATPGRPLLRDARWMAHALSKLWSQVDLIVFCLPPWEVARQNLSDIGRLSLQGVDQLALEKIHWAYEYQFQLFKECFFERVTLYDYTTMSKDHIREAIGELVRATS